MPTYTYRCHNCNHHTETHQHIHDNPHTHYPNCHTNQLHRTPNPINISLKSSGFYTTDNK